MILNGYAEESIIYHNEGVQTEHQINLDLLLKLYFLNKISYVCLNPHWKKKD